MMRPSKKTLGKLKSEIYINAVRLFSDACLLFNKHSYASVYALSILSLEELGKLEMVDHICDDISINPDSNPQDFFEHLFSKSMFFDHRNKQMWASDFVFSDDKKRIKQISEGSLDRSKQDAFYVGYFKNYIRSPKLIKQQKTFNKLNIVFDKFKEIDDLDLMDLTVFQMLYPELKQNDTYPKLKVLS